MSTTIFVLVDDPIRDFGEESLHLYELLGEVLYPLVLLILIPLGLYLGIWFGRKRTN